jgi:hypothetical protein
VLEDKMRRLTFLRLYTVILFLCLAGSVLALIYIVQDNSSDSSMFISFVSAIAIWHLLTVTGILLRSKWGYYFFKSFLFVVLLSFPIGTFVSIISLRYMKRNHIKDLFIKGEQSRDVLA